VSNAAGDVGSCSVAGVYSAVLVRRCRWSLLTVVLVLLVLHLMSRVLIRCLMGDFLC
jgi:hypothetical protein